MSIMNMAKNIKQIHPDSVICYRTGKFYSAYGKDCYILSDIFNYKINVLNRWRGGRNGGNIVKVNNRVETLEKIENLL